MPELPEVETTIRYLRPAMLDRVIRQFSVSNGGESQLKSTPKEVHQLLAGQKLKSLDRHGKWMLFDFGITKAVGHLRMSGRYKIAPEVLKHPHNRFQLHLEDGTVINYLDQRRFGTFDLIDDFSHYKGLAALGADALNRELTAEGLHFLLLSKKKPIYSALLDQTVIAGLGNIYVNEILHAADIHPLQPSNTITLAQTQRIVDEMQRILVQALDLKGTTLIDNLYQDPEGKSGQFAKLLQVYGKKNDPQVEVIKIGGRSVFVNRNTKLLA